MYETYPDLDHMDDDEDLDVKDLEDMSHHRFDDVHAKTMVRGKKSHADMKISGKNNAYFHLIFTLPITHFEEGGKFFFLFSQQLSYRC